MTEWLRQSTSVTVMLGPFLDATTANTDQTTLTITQPDIRISKNGGAWAQKAAAQTLTHAEAGWYGVTLDATDTNTLGRLKVAIHESPSLNVWEGFMVVTANVWDSLFGADVLAVDVTQWLGTAVTAGTAGVPNVDITRIANAAVSASTAQLGVNVVNFGGSAGTFAAGRPEVNTTHAAGTAWGSGAITAASAAADFGTEIANAVWALDATGQQTAGTFGKALGDPLARTNSLMQSIPDAVGGATGGLFIAGTNAATTVTTSFTTTFTGNLTGSVASVSGAVGSVTGLTASNLDATISSRLASASYTTPPTAAAIVDAVWDEDATAHQTAGTFGKAIGDPLASTNSLIQRTPDAVAGAAGGIFIAGTNAATTITTGLTTTFTGSLTGSVGSVTGAVGSVTGLTASNLDATVSSRLSTAGYTAPPSAATVSTAVWTEAVPGAFGAGTAGLALSAAGAAGDPWSTLIPGAYGAGTAGSRLGKLPDATAGAAGGLFIAGTNAPVTITTGLTTTFTGSLTGSVGSVTGAVGSVTGLTASNLDATVSSRLATAGYTVPPTAAANADAVWDEAISGHTSVGTFGQSVPIVRSGTSASGSPNAWQFTLDAGASAVDDFYKGCMVRLTGGVGVGQIRIITSYVGSTKTCNFFTGLIGTLPDNATQFVIVSDDALNSGNDLGEIAYSVWNWDIPGSHIAGTAGYKLNAASSAGDPWSTALPGAYGAGTAGSRLGKLPDVTAGDAGGVFIAGTNAATAITTSFTTTFTGSLTGSVGSVTGAVGSVTGLTASNLDATVSSRASQASVTTVDDMLDTELPAISTAVLTTIPGTITTLQADTDNIQTRLPAALVSGRIDASVGAAEANTINASALATDAVNEIAAAVGALAGADPASVPAANASLAAKIDWLCALARNKRTTTATTETLRNDTDSGSIGTAAISDDGSTFQRSEWA